MSTAIENVYYDSSTKIGLKFKRRFWEQDDQIYGGAGADLLHGGAGIS